MKGSRNKNLPLCFKRVNTWFKNHNRPSAQITRTRDVIDLSKRDPRKLSAAQRFSKIFYKPLYKKAMTKRWRDTYLVRYKEALDDAAEANTKVDIVDRVDLDKKVHDSIRTDLRGGLLDTALPVSPDDAEDDNSEQNREGEEGDEGDDDGPSSGEDDIRVPKIPVWYRNGIIRELWENASPSKRQAVEDYEKAEEDNEEIDEDDETSDDQKREKRLRDIMRFVRLWWQFSTVAQCLTSPTFSRREALSCTAIRLLDQIFEQTGLVGSLCLAGPDPQKGGKMMTMSYVYSLFLHSIYVTVLFSRIHKTLDDDPNASFADVYSHYKQAVADPMRSYSSLFFRMFVCFLHSFTHYLCFHVAKDERHKWALPGTEHYYNRQQDSHELLALQNSFTPRRLALPGISTTPSSTFSRTGSVPNTLHRRAINRNFHGNGNPSFSPSNPNDPSNLSAVEWEAKFARLVSDVGLSNHRLCSLSRVVHYK